MPEDDSSGQQDTSTCWNTRTPLDCLPKRQGYLTDVITVSTVASKRIWHCFLASPSHSISVLHLKMLDTSGNLGHPSSVPASSALCVQNRGRCQLTERSLEQLHCIQYVCLSIAMRRASPLQYICLLDSVITDCSTFSLICRISSTVYRS